ncbi:AI-2E family transporter [Geminocystis sp.]|uniref:AI-2E family transporter n=1 Tax=Geminocystis sp. TaxID=2664100 RepID=UPI003593C899
MQQPPSSQSWKDLSNSNLLRFVLLFSCSWVIVLLINYFYTTIAIFSAAAIFATLLNYPVAWLCRYMPRWLAIAITFLVAVVLLTAMVMLVGIEVYSQGEGLLSQLRNKLNQKDFLPFQDFLLNLEIKKIIETVQGGLASGLTIVQKIFSSFLTLIFGAVISLYMLIDGDKLWQLFLQLIPLEYRSRFAQTFEQSFLGFLRGQLLLMLFLSIATFITFSFLGVSYALILSVIIGILDVIPGIGATLGLLIVAILVFASQGMDLTIKIVITSILLQQIQDNYLQPKIMGNALELNPVLLFLALFLGERIAGLLGVFLAIPIAGMIAAWIRLVKTDNPISPETIDKIEPSKTID